MTASPPPPGESRPRRWLRVLAWTTALAVLLAGVAGFFLTDPLHLSGDLLDVLDKRVSVISMVAGLLFGALEVWLQPRHPSAPAPLPPAPSTTAGF